MAIGEIDRQPPIVDAGAGDDAGRLDRRPPQRLLAEHGAAGLERQDRLLACNALGVAMTTPSGACASRSSSDRTARRVRRDRRGARRAAASTVGEGHDRGAAGRRDRLQAVAADPAEAEEAEAGRLPSHRDDGLQEAVRPNRGCSSKAVGDVVERRPDGCTAASGSSTPRCDEREGAPHAGDVARRIALVRVHDVEAAPVPERQVDLRRPSWW